jgi:hypothetical protein
MIHCKPPLEFVVFWPETLIRGIKLSVIWVTDEEFDKHSAILHGIGIVIEGVLEVDLG